MRTIFCLLLVFGLSAQFAVSKPSTDQKSELSAELFFYLDWYHVTFNDDNCGTVTIDGYANWNSDGSLGSYCLDVTSDCGHDTYSGISAPDISDHSGKITHASVEAYVRKRLK